MTREESVRAAVEAAVARFGKLDTLFNCAGGSMPADKPVTELDLSVWEHTIGLDLKGTMLACRHAIPRIIAAGGGAVINMSSGAALRGASPAHVYTAAKGAIVSLTRAGRRLREAQRARELHLRRPDRHGARAPDLRPPRQAGRREDRQDATGQVKIYPFWVGKPEDIASIALFLASDESRMIPAPRSPRTAAAPRTESSLSKIMRHHDLRRGCDRRHRRRLHGERRRGRAPSSTRPVEHVDAMNATGLRISGSKSLKIPARAMLPREPERSPGLVFLAVKSQDTEAALETLSRRSPVRTWWSSRCRTA